MEKIESYYNLLPQWLNYYGFEEVKVHESAGPDKVFRRSRVEATKFGKVDCYVCAKHYKTLPTGGELMMYSGSMFSLASRHRTGMPLGFGAMLVVYPLVIVENINQELADCLAQYCPKHFAAAEFPSAFDMVHNNLYYYPSTPVWGAAYYSNYRKETYKFFSPKAWADVTKQQIAR